MIQYAAQKIADALAPPMGNEVVGPLCLRCHQFDHRAAVLLSRREKDILVAVVQIDLLQLNWTGEA